MPLISDIVAPVGAEHNTLYVAIEISRKSWVIGIKSPASERIGLHSLGAANVVGLKDLIEHQQTKAERALGREVRVLCCYEAGYEGFWLARWLDRAMSVETVVLERRNLGFAQRGQRDATRRILLILRHLRHRTHVSVDRQCQVDDSHGSSPSAEEAGQRECDRRKGDRQQHE